MIITLPIQSLRPSLHFLSPLNNCARQDLCECSCAFPNKPCLCKPAIENIYNYRDNYYAGIEKSFGNVVRKISNLPVYTCLEEGQRSLLELLHDDGGSWAEIHVACIQWQCILVCPYCKRHRAGLNFDAEVFYKRRSNDYLFSLSFVVVSLNLFIETERSL